MNEKRTTCVSVDDDLAAEFEVGGEALSGQVNDAIRAAIERHRRHRLLSELLDQLDAEHGPIDEALVARYTDILR